MLKRILVIIAILVLIGGAFLFFNKKQAEKNGGESIIQKSLNLFPFGNNASVTPANNTETPTVTQEGESEEVPETTLPRMRKLSSRAVAGATSLSKQRAVIQEEESEEASTEPAPVVTTTPTPVFEEVQYVRFIEKSTGNIYDIGADESIATRITNTTIPRVSEAMFTSGGQNVIVRYLEKDNQTIASWSGTIIAGPENEPAGLTGNFLEENITSLSISPDGTRLFYTRDIGDVTYGYTSLPDGTEKKQIFDSSFSAWLSEWARTDEITLTAKASGYLEGYSYALTSSGNSFKKIMGPIFGLTRLTDPSGTYSLYSFASGRGLQLRILNEKTGKQSTAPVTTFPEKCVWSHKESAVYCAVPSSIDSHIYPDEWYQGLFSTSDSLWKIDATYGAGLHVIDLSQEGGEPIDAVSLGLTEDESMLYFINKRDGMLWGVTL